MISLASRKNWNACPKGSKQRFAPIFFLVDATGAAYDLVRKSMNTLGSIILSLLCIAPFAAQADGLRGVIQDPDGYTNVRAAARSDSTVVDKVVLGEVFEFDAASEGARWMRVKLKNGKSGYVHASRVRFYATAKDLANKGPANEIEEHAKALGVDFYPVARAAAKGDEKALRALFSIDADGAAAELHHSAVCTVIHLLGDEKLSEYLRSQSGGDRKKARGALIDGITLAPFNPEEYLKTQFPKAAAALGIR